MWRAQSRPVASEDRRDALRTYLRGLPHLQLESPPAAVAACRLPTYVCAGRHPTPLLAGAARAADSAPPATCVSFGEGHWAEKDPARPVEFPYADSVRTRLAWHGVRLAEVKWMPLDPSMEPVTTGADRDRWNNGCESPWGDTPGVAGCWERKLPVIVPELWSPSLCPCCDLCRAQVCARERRLGGLPACLCAGQPGACAAERGSRSRTPKR